MIMALQNTRSIASTGQVWPALRCDLLGSFPTNLGSPCSGRCRTGQLEFVARDCKNAFLIGAVPILLLTVVIAEVPVHGVNAAGARAFLQERSAAAHAVRGAPLAYHADLYVDRERAAPTRDSLIIENTAGS